MITVPDYAINFVVKRPTGNERYRNLCLYTTIFGNDGKEKLSGMVTFEAIDEIHIQLNGLYNDGTSIIYQLPMTNAMHRYVFYAGKINYEMYHIFIVRDDSRTGLEETIISTKLDGFELSFLLYELGKELLDISEGVADIM